MLLLGHVILKSEKIGDMVHGVVVIHMHVHILFFSLIKMKGENINV